MRLLRFTGLFILGAGTAGAASAHGGHAAGLVHGFLHPLSGVDHLATMVAVGLLAVALGRRALLRLPASFMAAMLVGFVLGVLAIPLPGVEMTATVSGAIIAALVLLRRTLPVAAAGGLVAFFGLFHGHAHGAEMALGEPILGYAAGFLIATAAVQATAIGVASLAAHSVRRLTPGAADARKITIQA